MKKSRQIRNCKVLLHFIKFTILQIFIACLFISMSYSRQMKSKDLLDQVITINAKDTELKIVLAEIEKLGDLKFGYSPKLIDSKQHVSIQASSLRIEDVLKQLFTPLGISYRVVSNRISLYKISVSEAVESPTQSTSSEKLFQEVSGTVIDEKGAALPGVSIFEKGTTSGTTTDVDGKYKLEVNENAVLIFSFIGYVTEERLVGRETVINVSLTPSLEMLTEIIVVGYGTQKKRDITGALSSINAAELHEVPTTNISQALQGRLAGVDISRTGSTPGSGAEIRIRGNRSLTGSSDPLIVLDGIPFGGTLNDLNPDIIASVDVLKDASATAIYGSRGANGVILITTRQGKSGPAQLRYSGYYGVSQPFGTYKMFNANEFMAFRNLAQYSAGYSDMEKEGIANGTNTDWQKVTYKDGFQTNHDLNLSGSTENVSYNLGAGYFKEGGILPGQSFERYTLQSKIDGTVGSRIKIGLNSINTLSYRNGEGINPVYNVLRITPLSSVYNADGTPNLFPMDGTIDATSTMNPLTLKDKENIVDRRRRLRTFNSLFAEIKIVDGLKYRLNIGLDFAQDNRGTYTGPGTIMNPAASDLSGAKATVENGENWQATFENLLTYTKTFSEKHDLTLTGLFSTQTNRSFTSGINGNGFPAGAVEYYNFNLLTTTTPANGNFSQGGLESFMARLNYTYSGRYMLTATFRRDGSSVFTVNKFLNYPAFALGWNIAEEEFMKGITAIDALKLRLGYGATGQQSIPGYGTRGLLSQNRYNFGDQNLFGYYISSLPNKDLRWEYTKQWNLGLDFSLARGRVTGAVEVYQQNTDNLIVNKKLPISNGATSYYTNAAATEGKGVEVTLSTINIKSASGFTWSSDFNFSMNREKIVRLADETTKQDVGNGWFVGQPINVIYDYKKIGIWQINEADQAALYGATPGQIKLADISGPDGTPDGKITSDDRSVIGNYQPNWIGGMTQRIAFKNFDLSTVLFARMGATLVATYLSNNGQGTGYFGFGTGRSNQVKVNYWTPNNPTNDFPKPVVNSDRVPYSSTLTYYDASFIKVRSINLGYNVPNKLTERAGIKSVRIYFTVNNPFILYSPFVQKGLGFDPEGTGTGGAVAPEGSPAGTGVSSRAITVGTSTPSTRQFLLGVNARF